jgi:hypothetical protein
MLRPRWPVAPKMIHTSCLGGWTADGGTVCGGSVRVGFEEAVEEGRCVRVVGESWFIVE